MANALLLGADTFNCDLEGQLGEVIDEEMQTAGVATLRLRVVLLIIWIPAFVNLCRNGLIKGWNHDQYLSIRFGTGTYSLR